MHVFTTLDGKPVFALRSGESQAPCSSGGNHQGHPPERVVALLLHRPQLKDEDYPADAEGSGARQLSHGPDSCAHPTDEDVDAADVQAVGTPEVIHIYALRDAAQLAREARETLS